jgi:hypothetical protein
VFPVLGLIPFTASSPSGLNFHLRQAPHFDMQIISAIFEDLVITEGFGKIDPIDIHKKLFWILKGYWAPFQLDFASHRISSKIL